MLIFLSFALLTVSASSLAESSQFSPSSIYLNVINAVNTNEENLQIGQSIGEDISRLFYNLPNLDSGQQDSAQCLKDVLTVTSLAKNGVQWATQYMDSMGSKPSGTLSGNLVWLGEFDQCRRIGSVQFPDKRYVEPQYCRMFVGAKNAEYPPPQLMTTAVSLNIGVCMPKTCDIETLKSIVDGTLGENSTSVVILQESHCFQDDLPYSAVSIVSITIFTIVGVFLLAGLIVDVTSRITAWSKQRSALEIQHSLLEEEGDVEEQRKDCSSPDHSSFESSEPNYGNTLVAKFRSVILCFSPYSNFIKVTSVSEPVNPKNNLSAINAIRTLSIAWVVLGHTYLFILNLYDNFIQMQYYMDRFTWMFILGGFFAVDSFFFLSGFLAYWSLAKLIDPEKGVLKFLTSVPVFYFHRYVRLTPPLAALILLAIGIWPHLSNGPYWFQDTDYNCAKYWWNTLIYLNNFIDSKNMCVGWSWYLSVDMQLFLVAPFLIYLFRYKPKLGWLVSIGLLLVQLIVAFALTYAYNLPLSSIAPINATMAQAKDYGDFFDYLYIKPYLRMGPYIVGLVTAYAALNCATYLRRKVFDKIWISATLWISSFAVAFLLIYGIYGIYAGKYVDPLFFDALYNGLARTAWGFVLAWILLACIFNRAGPVGGFLNWPVWSVPARLSYCVYLFHPMVLMFYGETSRRSFYSSDINTAFLFTATFGITLGVSTIFSLAFESPVIGLQRLLIPSKSKK